MRLSAHMLAAVPLESLEPRTLCAAVHKPIPVDLKLLGLTPALLKSIELGTRTSVSLSLKNVGTATAKGKATLSLYLSKDARVDPSDQRLVHVTLAVNAQAGVTVTEELNFTYPKDLAAGNYRLIATFSSTFPDRTPGNNTRATHSTVKLIPRTKPSDSPDLLVSKFDPVLPRNFPYAAFNPVSVVVRNKGATAVTKPFAVALYASRDKTIGDADDVLLATANVTQSVPAKHDLAVDLSFTTPATIPTGFYWVGVRVDTTGAIRESSEGNNTFFNNISVHFDPAPASP